MATSKLNYAGLRSAQRKNKSMNETNPLLPNYNYSGHSIHSNQSPPFSLEHHNILQKDTLSKGKYGYNMFDESSLGEKSNQAKSLFSRINDEPIRYEAKPTKGHHRVKSSITEMYQRSLERQEEDNRSKTGSILGRYQGSLNRRPSYGQDSTYANGSSDDIAGRFIEDHRIVKEIGREIRNLRDEKNISGTGTFKEGKTLGDFLTKDGGFGKGTMSPEEMRLKRKEVSINNDFIGGNIDKRSAIKLSVGKSPKGTFDDVTTPKDFISNLDNYIDYFKKTDRSQRKESKAIEYTGIDDEDKLKEDNHRDYEIKQLKSIIEELSGKVNEVSRVNKKLVKEFGSMLNREQESTQRLGRLEEELHILKGKNKKYRERLKLTAQLLEKERMDNQNNLLALKKVLSNGINMALENKVRRNLEAFREKHPREESGSRGTPIDKNKEERRDNSHGKKSSEKKKSQKREESLFAQKSSLFSDDDSVYVEKQSERQPIIGNETEEEEKQDTSEPIIEDTDNGMSDHQESKEKYKREHVWSPQQQRHKETIRDQQIRALQEKIAEMMESQQDSSVKYKVHQEKFPNQQKSKNPPKHSFEMNIGNYDYMPVAKERHNNHLKVQGYFPRY